MTCTTCSHTPEICKPISGWKLIDGLGGFCPCCVQGIKHGGRNEPQRIVRAALDQSKVKM